MGNTHPWETHIPVTLDYYLGQWVIQVSDIDPVSTVMLAI